jgi:transketolase
MKNTFARILLERAKQDKNIQLVTGDLGFGVFRDFVNEVPEQFVNGGIAEQNLMSMAGGMASIGLRPIAYSIGNFVTLRCYEQIRNDVCYYNADVKIVGVSGGFIYGPLGVSHHSTEDVAVMRALPNMSVFTPSDKKEVELLSNEILNLKTPCYLRLEKDTGKDLHPNIEKLSSDSPNIMVKQDNAKTAIFAYGSIADEAFEASKILGLDSYSVPCLKPINEEKLLKLLKNYTKIYTLEEHNILGGLFSLMSEINAKYSLNIKIFPFAVMDVLCSAVGDQEYMKKFNHIDLDSVVARIKKGE